jgi:hypothetical protein
MIRKGTFVALALAVMVLVPASAAAAGPGAQLVDASILGSIFGTIGHVILGAFSWTAGLASKFLLTTLAGFVKLLIPQSWINQGLSVMEWIVSVPDYAGTVSTPGGGHSYGFAGINALRDLFMWLGIAIAPLSLTYATSKALVGESEPIVAPIARVVGSVIAVATYGYWWQQAAALADQITHAILTLPDVSQGLDKLMTYAVGGVALGGWQLIDLGLMAAIGLELLGLIFLKVVLILCGALLYATGPLMIGLVATRGGHSIARAWASAASLLFAIGIAWATLFAVGALLINDAGTAGPLIAGNSAFGSLMGGLMLALAGLASLWMCLKVAREAGGILRLQLAGAFSLGVGGGSGSTRSYESAARTTGRSLRHYGARLAGATSAAGAEIAGVVPGAAAISASGRAARQVGRRGLIGTATSATRVGARGAARPVGAIVGRSRAGAVAVRAARAGFKGWNAPASRQTPLKSQRPSSQSPESTPAKSERPILASARSQGTNTGLKSAGRPTRPPATIARQEAPRQPPKRKGQGTSPSPSAPTTATTRGRQRAPETALKRKDQDKSPTSTQPPESVRPVRGSSSERGNPTGQHPTSRHQPQRPSQTPPRTAVRRKRRPLPGPQTRGEGGS